MEGKRERRNTAGRIIFDRLGDQSLNKITLYFQSVMFDIRGGLLDLHHQISVIFHQNASLVEHGVVNTITKQLSVYQIKYHSLYMPCVYTACLLKEIMKKKSKESRRPSLTRRLGAAEQARLVLNRAEAS